MKKLLIILLSALSLTTFAQQKKVAVYVTGEQSGVKKILADKLVEAITYSNKYIAIERTSSFLTELKKEQSYQRSGEVDDNEIARLGIQFGVNYVCAVDVIEEFGQKYITARLIDVETTAVLTTGNASSDLSSMDELLKCASTIAKNITGKTAQEQLAEKARQEAEEKAKMAQKIKDLEIEDSKLKEQLDKGCLEVGSLLVTWPPIGYSLLWEQALQASLTCEVGGWTDWRLANQNEASMICELLTDKYYIPYEEQSFANKYSKLYEEKVKIYQFFNGRTFWIQNNTLFYCTKERHGYGPRAEYAKGIRYVSEVIMVRTNQ